MKESVVAVLLGALTFGIEIVKKSFTGSVPNSETVIITFLSLFLVNLHFTGRVFGGTLNIHVASVMKSGVGLNYWGHVTTILPLTGIGVTGTELKSNSDMWYTVLGLIWTYDENISAAIDLAWFKETIDLPCTLVILLIITLIVVSTFISEFIL